MISHDVTLAIEADEDGEYDKVDRCLARYSPLAEAIIALPYNIV